MVEIEEPPEFLAVKVAEVDAWVTLKLLLRVAVDVVNAESPE